MVRVFVVAVCLAAPLAAQVAPAPAPSHTEAPPPAPASPLAPSTAPHAALPATRPSPDQLHAQAYAFMRAGEFDKATPLLNRAYNQTPPAQRGRALVLNRALLDLVQKRNVLRGVKDLSAWFEQNPVPDEQASNILGASLDLVANNARWREGPIYAAALREFARREAALERARPGLRRWGAGWISEEEFQRIRQKQKEHAERTEAAYEVLVARNNDLKSVAAQYETARKQYGGFRFHQHGGGAPYRSGCPQCDAFFAARDSVNGLARDIEIVRTRLDQAQREYNLLQKQQIKPEWPARFDPIDPFAPQPQLPPPPPLRELGAATQPAE